MRLYLRADTRAAMDAALLAAGIPAEGCDWCAIDHIGPVYGPFTGPPGEETCSVIDARHHTNLLFHGAEPSAAQVAALPVIPAPETPARTWA